MVTLMPIHHTTDVAGLFSGFILILIIIFMKVNELTTGEIPNNNFALKIPTQFRVFSKCYCTICRLWEVPYS